MNKRFIILMCISVLLMVNVAFAISTLPDGNKNYFKLDETSGATRMDSVTSINYTVSGATVAAGKINASLAFDGNADYLDLGDYSGWDGLTNYSWMAWVYSNSSSATQKHLLTKTQAIRFYQSFSPNPGAIHVETGSGAANTGGFYTTQDMPQNQWVHLAIVKNTGTTLSDFKIYYNGILQNNTLWYGTLTDAMPNNGNNMYLGDIGASAYAGQVDEVGFWNRTLSPDEVLSSYNNSNAFPWNFSNGTTPTPPSVTHLQIQAKDEYNQSSISVFNLTITSPTNTTFYSTTNGTINTNIASNDTTVFNITNALTYNYYEFNRTIVNNNASPYVINFSRANVILSYSNYTTNASVNYTDTLVISATVQRCYGLNKILYYANGTAYPTGVPISGNLNCASGENQTTSVSIRLPQEGFYSVYASLSPAFNSSSGLFSNTTYYNTSSANFVSDIYRPYPLLSYVLPEGLTTNASVNVSMQCIDTYPLINYTLLVDSTYIINANYTANTTRATHFTSLQGENDLTATCSDPFGSNTSLASFTLYSKTIGLWNERNNTAFPPQAISSARLWQDDNATSFDFYATNRSNVTVTTTNNTKFRVELGYTGGTIITRYIDISLPTESFVKVCTNDVGTTHYAQIATSTGETPIMIKNVNTLCYVGADYTRFAYLNAYALPFYTIDASYYLYNFVDGVQNILVSIDGSTNQAEFNIDAILFQQRGYNFEITKSALSYMRNNNLTELGTLEYQNIGDPNRNATLTVTREDTNEVVFTTTEVLTPNEFSVSFNYSSLLNVTNSTLFKATVTEYKANNKITTVSIYFSPSTGNTGRMLPAVAIALSLAFVLFGLTIVVAASLFKWFGAVVMLVAMGILGNAPLTDDVGFIMMLYAVAFVFFVLFMLGNNLERGLQ